MKTKAIKWLAALLAGLMLCGSLVACGENTEDPAGDKESAEASGGTETTPVTEEETDPVQDALDLLKGVDYGNREFGILYNDHYEPELVGESGAVTGEGSSQVISNAVYLRNTTLEDFCKLKLVHVPISAGSLPNKVQTEGAAPTGDFKLVDAYYFDNSSLATGNYLYDLVEMDVNLEGPWWDKGTADFILMGGVYFMSGSLNIMDDNATYIMLFNKELRKTYANTVADPYTTVRNWEWTLDYFNNIIQGIAKENGDGKWDHLDTYGFVTTHEYGTSFFIGSDMRYIQNDSDGEPTLYLGDQSRMEQALDVVDLSRKIYHDNNVTYMAPGWEEDKSYNAFVEDRAMFYGETCMWIDKVAANMRADYGVLPVPKYDKAQENYHTWTHSSGSSFSVVKALSDDERETVGNIFEAYAVLSHKYLQPAYYDVKLTKQNIVDADSVEMMELLFSNRVYDMAFYFDFGFSNLVHDCVNNDTDNFSSGYKRGERLFKNKLKNILSKLEDKN